MKLQPLGPWPAGIINAVPATRIPAASGREALGGLRDAVNVDIDETGTITRRSGWTSAGATPAHSLFEHAGTTYCVLDGGLGYLDGTSHVALGAVVGKVAWTLLNGEPCFATPEGVFLVRDAQILPVPVGFANDEEDELMLSPLPGGHAVAYWKGRLLVLRGNSLLWSEPLRYGVFNPMTNFVQFEERASWFAPLDGGVYVGLRRSVRFLAGNDPAQFVQRQVAGPSWHLAGMTIPTVGMNPQIAQGAPEVAAWFSARGFSIGLPSGTVVYPQGERLTELPLGAGRLVVLGDRITVLSN